MVPASLQRTSGLRLLSYCNQTYSCSIAIRPLLFTPLNYYSSPKPNTQHKNKNNNNIPSLSFSITSFVPKEKPQVASRSIKTFCASSNVTTTDPSTPTTTSSDDNVVDMMKIKEMANTLDLRVGKILKAWRHEEADLLYVEEIDVGEPEPRIICSGLVKYIPLDELQDKNVVILANLKARNMRGVKSNGMVMAASDGSHETVELLEPPVGSVPGDRVWFGTEDEKENLPEVASPNQIAKKKIWEQVQPHLVTTGSCVATLGGMHLMISSSGSVVSKSLMNANIA